METLATSIPIADPLNGEGLTRPFAGEKLSERADKAWRSAGLDRITLHECRHTFASMMIAAGVNAKALSRSTTGR